MIAPDTGSKTAAQNHGDEVVGFIGLGLMGLPMALNVLRRGFPVIAYTRRPQRARTFQEQGGTLVDSLREVAERADCIITMLPDTADVEDVMKGPNGVLAWVSGGTWIDMSSVSPATTRALATEAKAKGLAVLDAPVSGGERGAVEAALSIMVGGSRSTLDSVMPLLSCMGRNVVHIGEANGSGQIAKLCNQIVVGCAIAALAEAFGLAVASGVDPAVVRQAMTGGFADSRVLDIIGKRMLERDATPGFRLRLHEKDLANAVAAGRRSSAYLPLSAAVLQLMTLEVGRGRGDADHSTLFEVFAPSERPA